MRWRWLLGDYADPAFKLTRDQRREVTELAHRRYVSRTALVVVTVLLAVVPAGVAFPGMKYVLGWLGMTGQNGPFLIGLVIMLVLFWPLSAWTYSWVYGRPCRRAMQDLGFPVCVGCGYSLEGLGPGARVCPECGRGIDHRA